MNQKKQIREESKSEWREVLNSKKISKGMEGRHLILLTPKEDTYDDNEWSYLDDWIEMRLTAERERIEGVIRKQKERVHEYDSEAFGYDLLEDFIKHQCCPGDDAAYGFKKACDEILKAITTEEYE